MSDQNDAPSAMSDANDVQKSLDQMKVFMELRGLQPNTVYTFTHCARRFLAHAGKAPVAIGTADVESFLLDLTVPRGWCAGVVPEFSGEAHAPSPHPGR
jgi:Phage integrase, N-terminal SAM-like domain